VQPLLESQSAEHAPSFRLLNKLKHVKLGDHKIKDPLASKRSMKLSYQVEIAPRMSEGVKRQLTYKHALSILNNPK
jgi:hypothetical protein